MKRKQVILASLLVVVCVLLGVLIRPASHLWKTHRHDASTLARLPRGQADDISHLNKTPVRAEIAVAADTAAALRQLRELLRYADQQHLPIAIAGAKHSMGGHTLAPDGIRLNMLPFRHLHLDTTTQVLTVGSGALWADVIPYLNRYGRAVATMQSDNAFSVGGSLSVNCHGWQPNQPPIAGSVEAIRVLLADGRVLTCSRRQNQQLFSLVLGGYGLLGIILEAQLRTVPNEQYSYHRVYAPAATYLEQYAKHVDRNPRVGLAYGRLNVTPDNFLEGVMLNYFEREGPAPRGGSLQEPGLTDLKRAIFLGSKRDGYGKQLRWNMERTFTRTQVGNEFTRNQIMNESPALYLNRTAGQTDVLHEYFIPRRNFDAFRRALQRIVPRHQADLLNITLRNVYPDKDTFLPYAREEVFGFVMFFNQDITPQAEQDMQQLTQELIEAATRLDGVYYLPYRLHATDTQLENAYPMMPEFLRLKRQYDPRGLFQNTFYQQYQHLAPAANVAARN
ncbi:FAD-binding oxidoreductase [Hymenobacter metallicola]|uniref:FAD-binding oxidoreductase n=1 Tax=Hymenobacter metallicola TaxID=2563114 RepID=A0A4Z0QHW7_9BACT|nr:FAD-binding oxidoreductase [Hymenobacter metallicola]TGE29076.1 FAD-binding oxidoreductase [Hymenobacter metallicola]